MTTFYKNFVEQCVKNGYSVSGAAKAIGLSNAAACGWKNGKIPNSTTQAKIAALFGISTGALMGEDPDQADEAAKKERPVQDETLSPEKQAAWELLQKMDDETLRRFIRAAQAMLGD